MNNFKEVVVNLDKVDSITCKFYEHDVESILIIQISGVCSHGSRGENYGQYLYQIIGLALLKMQPIAVLIDISELAYNFGDRILHLFQIFSDIKPFGDESIITAFILSEKNISGLASLLNLDVNNPHPPFYDNASRAYKSLISAYDKI